MLIQGSEETFESLINDKLVLVDFYADWCGPCKALGPILEELDNIKIIKMNVDQCPNITKKLGIMTIPTLIMFKDSKKIDSKVGLISKDAITTWLNSN